MPCSSSDPASPVTFLIVAGGTGLRMESDIPKQFLPLCGKPVLMHTLSAFSGFCPPGDLLLVLPPAWAGHWGQLCHDFDFRLPHHIAPGGASRFDSVKNGLALIPHDGLVAIHDGARPLVSPALVRRLLDLACREGNAIPLVPITDSVRHADLNGNRQMDREHLYSVQTPQVFRVPDIKKAFDQPYRPAFTDDASVYEGTGGRVHWLEGERENLKITEPPDLLLAACLLESR